MKRAKIIGAIGCMAFGLAAACAVVLGDEPLKNVFEAAAMLFASVVCPIVVIEWMFGGEYERGAAQGSRGEAPSARGR